MNHAWRAVVCLGLGALAPLGLAVAGPGQQKLPAPDPVTCPVAAGVLTVSWPLVPGAAAYQLHAAGALAGVELEATLFVDAPPLTSPVPSGLSLDLRVRALPASTHGPDHPPQGVGPKGQWSEPCLVVVP